MSTVLPFPKKLEAKYPNLLFGLYPLQDIGELIESPMHLAQLRSSLGLSTKEWEDLCKGRTLLTPEQENTIEEFVRRYFVDLMGSRR